MKTLIHDIVTSIKFLYPCIAYEESSTDTELLIKAETDLKRVYPVQKSVLGMISIGQDYWGRDTFKDANGQYYCEVDGALYFKGYDAEGEPNSPVKKEIQYAFPEIDKEYSQFKPFVEKVRKYFADHDKVELVDVNISVEENSKSILDNKIICLYKVKLK